MRPRSKPRVGDIIRDYTESDAEMKNLWNAGGQHVRYRIHDIKKGKIVGLRLSSPGHTVIESKNFNSELIKPVSQTVGIFENRK